MNDVSILIVTWKADELLHHCIKSILTFCKIIQPEIIVVDNANLSSTKKLALTFPSVIYVPSPRNLGFAGGNNLGLVYSTKRFVFLLNNDTILKCDIVTLLRDYLLAHSNVAVVQGCMNLPLHNNTLDICGGLLTPSLEIYFRNQFHKTATTPRTTRPVFVAKGACLMFKREILPLVGGNLFYDHFISDYEESDFCHRVWLSGYEVHFVNTPPIDHLMGQTVKRINSTDYCSQSLSNHLFSFFTLLSPKSILTYFPFFCLFHLLIVGRCLTRFDMNGCRTYWLALRKTISRRDEIVKTREKLQRKRVKSDKEIFEKTMVTPSFRYYYMLLRGNLKNYDFEY